LPSIIIPSSVISISNEAFYDCQNLTSVIISPDSSLNYIGNSCFKDSSLNSLTYESIIYYAKVYFMPIFTDNSGIAESNAFYGTLFDIAEYKIEISMNIFSTIIEGNNYLELTFSNPGFDDGAALSLLNSYLNYTQYATQYGLSPFSFNATDGGTTYLFLEYIASLKIIINDNPLLIINNCYNVWDADDFQDQFNNTTFQNTDPNTIIINTTPNDYNNYTLGYDSIIKFYKNY